MCWSGAAAVIQPLCVTGCPVQASSQVEAMTMGDRVAVMKDGLLQQCDTPRALYADPVNAFVAGFIGSPAMNLLQGTVEAGGVRIASTVVGEAVTVGLRPESLSLAPAGDGLPVVVTIVEELGAEAFLHAQLADQAADAEKANIIARAEPLAAPGKGDVIHLHVKEGSMLFFDAVSGDRIATRS